MYKTVKRILALVLAAATLLTVTGCGAAAPEASVQPQSQETTQAAVETAQPQSSEDPQATQAPATEQTEPAILEGTLYLKVSSITFSVVGESEDIYLGLIPRELVSWESEDPQIVSVENGVLTAVGVGTTVIRGTYADRQVSCTAGCLAQTREELEVMDPNVLSQPKWLLPEVDLEAPCTYFDNAAIVGDSITYGMMQYESGSNALGDILFLARGGISVLGFVVRNKNIYFQGREMELEDIIALSGVERVYFLVASNDIAAHYDMDYMMDNWKIVLDRIWEKSPGVEVVLISSIPKYESKPYAETPESYNRVTVEYNRRLREFARENDCRFLDLHPYIQDHWGRLPQDYKIDDTHLTELGCTVWMQVMRYYAQYESEGGILE